SALSFYVLKIFRSDVIFSPAFQHPIADWGEQYFHNRLGNRSGKGAHCALYQRPVESVPEYGREYDKYYHGEYEVIYKLSGKRGNIGSDSVGQPSVRIFPERLSYGPVKEIVY